MTKIAYTYDPYAHVYVGQTSADRDPVVKDNWLFPAHSTGIAPPVTGEREAAVFDPPTQTWSVMADWRQIPLYDVATGAAYNPFDSSAGTVWIPVGPLPDWLTDQAPPSSDYVWSGGSWVVDAERVTKRLTIEANTQATQLLAAAELKTAGLTDAYVAGQLDDDEKSRFEAWAAYKRALFLIPSQAGYPQTIEWPVPPSA